MIPDHDLARSLAGRFAPLPANGWATLDPSMTAPSSTGAGGTVLRCGSWDAATAVAPAPLDDLLRGDAVAPEDTVRLGHRDARVLRSAGTARNESKETSR